MRSDRIFHSTRFVSWSNIFGVGEPLEYPSTSCFPRGKIDALYVRSSYVRDRMCVGGKMRERRKETEKAERGIRRYIGPVVSVRPSPVVSVLFSFLRSCSFVRLSAPPSPVQRSTARRASSDGRTEEERTENVGKTSLALVVIVAENRGRCYTCDRSRCCFPRTRSVGRSSDSNGDL